MGDPDAMFASRSVPEHLLRGAAGLPLLAAAFGLIGTVGPLSLLLLVPAVVLLRGCPTCWLLGLVQTRRRRDHVERAPLNPSCACPAVLHCSSPP